MARVAVVGGDGIGPEVTREAVRVLERVRDAFDLDLSWDDWDLGAERYLRDGVTITAEEKARLIRDYDAMLLGALGDARVPGQIHARDILLALRFEADLYINFRPCTLHLPSLSPLRDPDPATDFVVFRENTEGLYTNMGGRFKAGTPDEIAIQESLNTFKGVERIVRAAFDHAVEKGRTRVTLVDKANALPLAGALWRRVFRDIGSAYPGIEQDEMYVDAMAMDLVRRPQRYQVIVTSNLFGDILSDLGAQVTGGLGLAPSANLHPGRWALFEPVHGSAPDIAGTGAANPMAAIRCVSLLLDYLGEPAAAARVDEALSAALEAGVTTADLGGGASTGEVGGWVADHLGAGRPHG